METTHRLPRFVVMWSTLVWMLVPLGLRPVFWFVPTSDSLGSFNVAWLVGGILAAVTVGLRTFLQGVLYRRVGLQFSHGTWLAQTFKGYLFGELVGIALWIAAIGSTAVVNALVPSGMFGLVLFISFVVQIVSALIYSFVSAYFLGRMQAAVLNNAGYTELTAVWSTANVQGSLAAAVARRLLSIPAGAANLGRIMSVSSTTPALSSGEVPTWLREFGRLGVATPIWLLGVFAIVGYVTNGIPGLTTGLAVKRYIESQPVPAVALPEPIEV